MHELTRRGFLASAAILGLAGCAQTSGGTGGTGGAEPATGSRTVKHVFGETTLPDSITRVACIGLTSQDVCVLLGVSPVAINVFEVTGFDLTPWYHETIMQTLGSFPEKLASDDLPAQLSTLRRLQPDVILAVNSGMTQSEYKQFSEVAPVVAYPGQPWNTPWETTLSTVAYVLGQEDRVSEIRQNVLDEIKNLQGLYTDYSGTGMMYLTSTAAPGSDLTVYGPETNAFLALQLYGLVEAPAVAPLLESESIATDRNGLVPEAAVRESSVPLVIGTVPDKRFDALMANSSFARSLGRSNDNTILLSDAKEGFALGESSPLSIVWAAKRVIPEVARTQFASS